MSVMQLKVPVHFPRTKHAYSRISICAKGIVGPTFVRRHTVAGTRHSTDLQTLQRCLLIAVLVLQCQRCKLQFDDLTELDGLSMSEFE